MDGLTKELEDMMKILQNQERLLTIIEEPQTEIERLKKQNGELLRLCGR